MKTIALILIHVTMCHAQYISNGSFEQIDTVPFDAGQCNYATSWKSALNSPDLFSAYATNMSGVNIPNTFLGAITGASEGVNCIGLATYFKGTPNYREAITQKMIQPLIIGKTYELSLSVLTDATPLNYGGIAASDLGIVFSSKKLKANGTGIINIVPQCKISSPTYYYYWTPVHFTFVADSAYKWITVGCFVNDSIQQRVTVSNAVLFDCVYYFIDDIQLSEVVTSGIEVVTPIINKKLNYYNLLGQKIR